jgi:hypothetical protein
VGVILYLLVAGLLTAARLAFPVRPAELTPWHWAAARPQPVIYIVLRY